MSQHTKTLRINCSNNLQLQRSIDCLSEDYALVTVSENADLTCVEDQTISGFNIRNGTVTYRTNADALRAIAHSLFEKKEISENCPFETFGIMLDSSRNGVMKVSHFKKWLRRLALLGYNMAMLYTEDTYVLPNEDFFCYQRGGYTLNELQSIDAYAQKLGIEMIPCIQTLGHFEQSLKWPAYNDIKDTHQVLLTREEKTYQLIDKIISFWSQAFSSPRIHIGMDETQGLGRGNFMNHHGFVPDHEIFTHHLQRVTKICKQYQRKPMMWSDMFFSMGTTEISYYKDEAFISDNVAKDIPQSCDLVYWDYYHDNEDFYDTMIEKHRRAGKEPLLGSGVWTWSMLWHGFHNTYNNAIPSIRSAKKNKLRSIFFTMWGDDGNYCDFDSAFAGLALCADEAYNEEHDEERVHRLFSTVCHSHYFAHKRASDINTLGNGGHAFIWDDPLLQLYIGQIRHIDSNAVRNVAKEAENIRKDIAQHILDNESGSFRHLDTLLQFISQKCYLAEDLLAAYQKNDKTQVTKLYEQCQSCIRTAQSLHETWREVWLRCFKAFGLEHIQLRIAGNIARLQELSQRLEEWRNGNIEHIEELDVHVRGNPQVEKGWGFHQTFSSSTMRW